MKKFNSIIRILQGKGTRKEKITLIIQALTTLSTTGVVFFIFGFLLFLIILGGSSSTTAPVGDGIVTNKNLSEATLSFKSLVEKEATKQGVPELVPYILAIIEVESHGDVVSSGGDIMQSSESKYGGKPGMISTPEESVEAGVAHLVGTYNSTKQLGQDTLASIASYNFGGEYNLTWMVKNGESAWSYESAESYSAYKSGGKKVEYKNEISVPINGGWKYSYGNQFYPLLVKQYLTEGGSTGGTGEYGLPIESPIVTSPFGQRPATGVTPPQFHKGIDFGNPTGTEIKAAMDGEVVIAQRDGTPVDGYGICTVIKHSNGQWTLYAHQSEQFVKIGDTVKKGQVIGKIGSTGQVDGAHLHFEIRTTQNGGEGNVLEPAPLLGL